jgi:FemAB-related protein (PEP-CTERM system-associated)
MNAEQDGSAAPTEALPTEVTVTSAPPPWGDYLGSRADATICHEPLWGQIMARVYGKAPIYLTARREGRVVGVLQLLAQKSLLFGSYLCSLPYLDASGVLADDESARDALLARTEAIRAEMRCRWAELRQEADLGAGLPARTDKVRLELALPSRKEDLWESLKAKVRNQVRKAEKAQLTCAAGGGELVKPFYEVYLRNMRDLGSPPHSREWFQAIVEGLGRSARLFVVWAGNRPAAASLTLRDRQAMRVPWAGSDWRLSDSCPNMLLYWTMLAEACESGAGRFDFGRSTRDSGTYSFKRQWGAEPVPLYWHYLLPEGEKLPDLRPDSGKFRLMVAVWKRLPLWLARALGPRIIGRLS